MDEAYFVFRGIDQADATKLREQWLAAHREYVRRAGAVVMIHGGPLYDAAQNIVGTCLVLKAPAKAQAEAWLAREPFFRSGLFAIASLDQWGWTYGR